MNAGDGSIVETSARTQGWILWAALVLGVVLLFFLLALLRRYLLRPMSHTPTDTSDAWAEAGRRLQLESDQDADDRGNDSP